jgi:DNA (cytosine-5)-methyltransferase 1
MMNYYDDITTMHGNEAAAVDVIIGGSPCQDLSVAGQRAGLDGERSSLFLDQIRVIKEMHSKYGRNKPRYMVWENVPGALSSANGEDFRRVLEETAKVADETAVVPRPEKGKWTTAGAVVGDGYSIAWRILDAQFWGVPQRRRRIALVADFAGQSAPEILFKSESVSGYTAESREARQGTAGSAENGVGSAICIQGNCIGRADTAGCNGRGWRDDDVSYTLNTIDRPAVYDARGNGNGETAPTITGDHQNRFTDYTAICVADHPTPKIDTDDTAFSLMSRGYKAPHAVYSTSSHAGHAEGIGTLRAAGGDLGGGSEMLAVLHSTVRGLTPLECERLQGYPDGWSDIGEWTDSKGKKHQTTDSARYKALGNSIALPPWRFVCRRICEQYDTPATMGSLFDGIGGFPLIWREINGADSVPWACEIDEYCKAVTRRNLP